nr:transporter substrate-binding domain-containing protein [Roseibium hamelinense]
MKQIKALLGLAIVFAAFMGTPSAEEALSPPIHVRVVQDSNFPPFMMSSQTGAAGLYAALVREAGTLMPSFEIHIDAVPWKRALFLTSTSQADVLSGTYHKPAARPWIARYSNPMFNERVFVYCHRDAQPASNDYPLGFKGLVFGNNTGYQTPGPVFFEMVERGDIMLEEDSGTASNLRKLQSHRIDCYVQDETAADSIIEARAYHAIRKIVPVSDEAVFLGLSERFNDLAGEAFLTEFHLALSELKRSGRYDEIIRQIYSKTSTN